MITKDRFYDELLLKGKEAVVVAEVITDNMFINIIGKTSHIPQRERDNLTLHNPFIIVDYYKEGERWLSPSLIDDFTALLTINVQRINRITPLEFQCDLELKYNNKVQEVKEKLGGDISVDYSVDLLIDHRSHIILGKTSLLLCYTEVEDGLEIVHTPFFGMKALNPYTTGKDFYSLYIRST